VEVADGHRQGIGVVGLRILGSPSSTLVISWTCTLLALPYPVTACLMARGVYSAGEMSCREAARMITPRACPTASAVFTLTLTKSSSMATASGANRSSSARLSS
jgi:hypothetical protein